MFGALYGDVIGSYYEVHCTKEYDFPLMAESTFTDDSVLIAAVCKTILNAPSEIGRFGIRGRSRQFAAQYRQYFSYFPNAGFGQMFSVWARDYTSKSNHSYANGAAMRVMPIAWVYKDFDQMMRQVKASCLPTHNNLEAIKGAQAVAVAIRLALDGQSKDEIKKYIEKNYYNLSTPLSSIRANHVFDSRASYSVPPAIIAFLESNDYESAIRNAVSLGGDADTQACIAGGIAEAFYREIPEHIKEFCDKRIDITIKKTVREFEDRFSKENTIRPFPSWEETVQLMYDKGLDSFAHEVIRVLYSKDKSRRYVVYRIRNNLLQYRLERLFQFDEDEWKYYLCRDNNALPGYWCEDREKPVSVFVKMDDLLKELQSNPEYQQYF